MSFVSVNGPIRLPFFLKHPFIAYQVLSNSRQHQVPCSIVHKIIKIIKHCFTPFRILHSLSETSRFYLNRRYRGGHHVDSFKWLEDIGFELCDLWVYVSRIRRSGRRSWYFTRSKGKIWWFIVTSCLVKGMVQSWYGRWVSMVLSLMWLRGMQV